MGGPGSGRRKEGGSNNRKGTSRNARIKKMSQNSIINKTVDKNTQNFTKSRGTRPNKQYIKSYRGYLKGK
jgi:hypothetical protein